MWNLSSYNHSLARLYRFRDPKMEKVYQVDHNESCVYNTQIQYLTVLLVYTQGAFSYLGPNLLVGGFWIKTAIVAISALWLLGGFLSPAFKRHRKFIHFLFCLLYTVALLATCFYEPSFWTKLQCNSFIPDGHHLLLQGPDGTQSVKDDEFQELIWYLMAKIEFMINLAWVEGAQLHVAVNGMCLWTILSHLLFFTFSVLNNAFMVPQPAIDILFSTIQRFLLLMMHLALGLLIERVHRQRFLAQTLLQKQMHSAMSADSILNHMLKNTLADAAAHIELFLAGSAPTAALQDSVLCLRRGMKACKQRQLYLKLVAGEYVPVQNAVHLKEFGEQLVAGRAVRSTFLDLEVFLDAALLTLILDNALNNAFKHGHPKDPDVAFTIHQLEDHPLLHEARVEFLVTNKADPSRPPLTPEVVERIMAGDRKALGACTKSLLSDGIGLAHSILAAEVGSFALSLQQEEDHVVFRLVIETHDIKATESPNVCCRNGSGSVALSLSSLRRQGPGGALPPKLRFLLLDDTAASRKIMEHHIRTYVPTARVTTFGESESDIELFVAKAIEGADIVIVDQHLEYEASYLGTDALRQLVLLGFSGLMCVRSGDDAEEDRRRYTKCGAHCFLGKDLTGPEMVERLTAAYLAFRYKASIETLGCAD